MADHKGGAAESARDAITRRQLAGRRHESARPFVACRQPPPIGASSRLRPSARPPAGLQAPTNRQDQRSIISLPVVWLDQRVLSPAAWSIVWDPVSGPKTVFCRWQIGGLFVGDKTPTTHKRLWRHSNTFAKLLWRVPMWIIGQDSSKFYKVARAFRCNIIENLSKQNPVHANRWH